MSGQTRRARLLIAELGLQPHPEGGYFKEVFRSDRTVETSHTRVRRRALTTIYFLLTEADHSRWHVVEWDEIWHFYEGGPLELLSIDPAKMILQRQEIGPHDGDRRHVHTIPAGHWQAARPMGEFALCGCTVAPGFEFSDLRFVRDLPEADELRRRMPEVADLL